MWIQKLGWVAHQSETGDDLPILTIDIDPIQLRVLTGSTDNLRLWRFVCFLDGGKSPTLLAVLNEHQGTVNCARWSPVGNRFASAADDWKIVIWEYRGPATHSNLCSEDSIEDWRAVFVLKEHRSDVREIAWSSDGSLLASGSLDNTVLIWKYGQNFPIKSLDGGQVMGLAFDPMSKFLVSLAEDTVMNVWSVGDWHCLRQVQGVFKRSASQPLKRISISPDGRFIMTPGPRKTTFKYMASAFTRDSWEVDICLVGHLQTLSVAKCSPVLYRQQDGSFTWCVALGSYDCGVSIWRMGEQRPLVVRDLFESAVTDIAWSPDGQYVVVCSSDGSVVLIALGGEMGETVDRQETSEYLRGIYGEFPEPEGNQYVNRLISALVEEENNPATVPVFEELPTKPIPSLSPRPKPLSQLPLNCPHSSISLSLLPFQPLYRLPSQSVRPSLPLSASPSPTLRL